MIHYEDQEVEKDESAALLWWSRSFDPRAVNVRNDIIRGLYKCNNAGFVTDQAYLTDSNVIKASIARVGYKLFDCEETI